MAFLLPFVPYITAGAAVVSGVSAYRQGQAAESAANYNAQVQTQNAELARRDARLRATQVERENYLRLGAIRAAHGASGGVAGEGSVLDVLGDAAAQGELERQETLFQGEAQARGYTNTGQLDIVQGRNAARTGSYRAGAELLGGAASAYSLSNRLKRN